MPIGEIIDNLYKESNLSKDKENNIIPSTNLNQTNMIQMDIERTSSNKSKCKNIILFTICIIFFILFGMLPLIIIWIFQ